MKLITLTQLFDINTTIHVNVDDISSIEEIGENGKHTRIFMKNGNKFDVKENREQVKKMVQ